MSEPRGRRFVYVPCSPARAEELRQHALATERQRLHLAIEQHDCRTANVVLKTIKYLKEKKPR